MNRQGCIVWRENPRYVTLYIGTNKHADPRISYIEIGAALLRSMKARIYHRVLFMLAFTVGSIRIVAHARRNVALEDVTGIEHQHIEQMNGGGMCPDSYHFVGFHQSSPRSACCPACAKMDANVGVAEPHRALRQSNEYDDAKGRRLHYLCENCGAHWVRFIRNGQPGSTDLYRRVDVSA